MGAPNRFRTPQGRVPVAAASIDRTGDGGWVRFSGTDGGPEGDLPPLDLVSLASCASLQPGGLAVRADDLLALAQAAGPLFGRGMGERLQMWVTAAVLARVAVLLQECADDPGRVPAAATVCNVSQHSVEGAGRPFRLLEVWQPADPAYARWLGLPRALRLESVGEALVCSFARFSEEDEGLELVAAMFPGDPDPAQAAALASALGLGAEERAALEPALGEVPCEAPAFEVREVPVTPADAGALGALERALVAAHIVDAGLDVFQDDPVTGNLVFGSLLSWLWYDFAHRIGAASIGYCENCGRPFALTGHRGPKRRFCSAACKTEAKNERSRRQRGEVRRLFLAEGLDVDAVLLRVNGGRDEDVRGLGRESAVGMLESWPALKQQLARDVAAGDFRLLARCRDNGLDLGKLLNAPAREALQARLAGR